jgi:hypothetical protein
MTLIPSVGDGGASADAAKAPCAIGSPVEVCRMADNWSLSLSWWSCWGSLRRSRRVSNVCLKRPLL